jgi:ankyrin repeat protein
MRDHENGIDRRDKKGRTLLIAAAAEGNIGKVKRLLAEGADPNLTNSQTHITMSTEKPGRFTATDGGHDVSSHSQTLSKCLFN